MTNINFADLFAAATSAQVERISSHNGAGTMSLGIVNSKSNGRRLTLSKSLSKALDLEDTAYILPMASSDVVLITKDKVFPSSSLLTLSGDDKKIIYNSDAVHTLTKLFELDFSNRTSLSISDVTIEDHDGTPVAIVDMSKVSGDVA